MGHRLQARMNSAFGFHVPTTCLLCARSWGFKDEGFLPHLCQVLVAQWGRTAYINRGTEVPCGCFHEERGATERKWSTGWEKLRKGLPEGVMLELRGNNQRRWMVANAMPGMPTKELGPPDLLVVGQPHCKNLNLALKGQCPVFIFSCRVTKCHKFRGLNEHPFSSESMLWVSNRWNKGTVFSSGGSGKNSLPGSFKLMTDSVW